MSNCHERDDELPPPKPIDCEVAKETRWLRQFLRDREAAFARVCRNKTAGRSALRAEVLREAFIRYADGDPMRLRDYQVSLRDFGSSVSISNTIRRLEELGLLRLNTAPGDRRSLVVRPTLKLIRLFRHEMPRIGESRQ